MIGKVRARPNARALKLNFFVPEARSPLRKLHIWLALSISCLHTSASLSIAFVPVDTPTDASAFISSASALVEFLGR